MIAEELGRNTSRKKAEEAKEKRKRLKELQQKKAATSAKIASIASTSIQNVQSPIVPAEGSTNAISSSTFPLNITSTNIISRSTTSKTNGLSAVEIANEQRQIRAKLVLQNRTVNKIQAVYRSYIIRAHQIEFFTAELQKKIVDIETLYNILLKKSSIYILPTSTATSLIRQFLFVSSRNIRRNDTGIEMTKLLCKLLDYAILPGLENSNHEKNPILPWIGTSIGEYRLYQFIRSLLNHYFNTHSESYLKSIVRCLQSLLVGSAALPLHCRSRLFPNPVKDAVTNDPSTIDMIRIIRQQLLRMGDKPIPSDAETKREACFASPDKNRIGMMIQLLLDIFISLHPISGTVKISIMIRAW